MSVFSCDIWKREFTGKENLTRHVKSQHGWSYQRCSQSFNRRDNYEMHQRVCLYKTTGKRSGGHLATTAKIIQVVLVVLSMVPRMNTVSILKMNSKMLRMYWMCSKNLLFR